MPQAGWPLDALPEGAWVPSLSVLRVCGLLAKACRKLGWTLEACLKVGRCPAQCCAWRNCVQILTDMFGPASQQDCR